MCNTWLLLGLEQRSAQTQWFHPSVSRRKPVSPLRDAEGKKEHFVTDVLAALLLT